MSIEAEDPLDIGRTGGDTAGENLDVAAHFDRCGAVGVPAQDGGPAFRKMFGNSIDRASGGKICVMGKMMSSAELSVIERRPCEGWDMGREPDA